MTSIRKRENERRQALRLRLAEQGLSRKDHKNFRVVTKLFKYIQDGVVNGSSNYYFEGIRDCFGEFWFEWKRISGSSSLSNYEYIWTLHQDKGAIRRTQPTRWFVLFAAWNIFPQPSWLVTVFRFRQHTCYLSFNVNLLQCITSYFYSNVVSLYSDLFNDYHLIFSSDRSTARDPRWP